MRSRRHRPPVWPRPDCRGQGWLSGLRCGRRSSPASTLASPLQSPQLVGFAVPLTSVQLAQLFESDNPRIGLRTGLSVDKVGSIAAGLSATTSACDLVTLYRPELAPYLTGPVEGVAFVAATASLGEALLADDIDVTNVVIKAAKWGLAGATLVADVLPIPGITEFKPQIKAIGIAVQMTDSVQISWRKATQAEAKKASEVIAAAAGHMPPSTM